MASERTGVVTLKGNPVTLVGDEVKVGDQAPNFTVVDEALGEVTLASSAGKIRILAAVPSVDTPVCDEEIRKFNDEVGKLPDNVQVLTISVDLPFAQKRWCGASGVDKVTALSDHRDANFGTQYGVLIKELRLLARAVFVVDASDKVVYAETVKEVAEHPNYEAVLNAARTAAS